MLLRMAVFIIPFAFVSSAHAESQAVRAFHSEKCLANIGKAGVADCAPGNQLTLLPVASGKVMLRAEGDHCLFANKDGRFAWYRCTPKFEDQHWELVAPSAQSAAALRDAPETWRMLKSVHHGGW